MAVEGLRELLAGGGDEAGAKTIRIIQGIREEAGSLKQWILAACAICMIQRVVFDGRHFSTSLAAEEAGDGTNRTEKTDRTNARRRKV